MRSLIHIGVLAALVLSFAKAPFDHTHHSDPHHEHATGLAHAHFKTDGPEGRPSWATKDHDSDARMLDWLPGDGRFPIRHEIALPESVAAPVLIVQIVRLPEIPSRGHDPPSRSNLNPRAPPA